MEIQKIEYPMIAGFEDHKTMQYSGRLGVRRTPFLALCVACLLCHTAHGQLKSLSSGNADAQWRDAQVRLLDEQLKQPQLPVELRKELTAQRGWLIGWDPKAKSTESKSDKPTENLKSNARLKEPVIDPEKLAGSLRKQLFDSKSGPTVEDTQRLQHALGEHSGDIGLRQLQLHWIDQPRYRDDYWKEIGEAADRVTGLLQKMPSSPETQRAAAFAFYRKARALAHCLRGRPIEKAPIAGADGLDMKERQQIQDAIGECWNQIETLIGPGTVDFFQLELYCLRRDRWNGRALELLEKHALSLEPSAYLHERKLLLEKLGWTKAAAQQASRIAALESELRTLEIQFVAIDAPATDSKK